MNLRFAFFDIGGVLGTNGWDRNQRKEAAEKFGLDLESFSARHEEVIAQLEEGLMTIDQYLDRTVFMRPRSFTPDDFRQFMYGCSKPFSQSIDYVRALAATGQVRLVTASNEADELSRYRIRLFGLTQIFDTFLASSWVGARKPARIFYDRVLAITQAHAEECVFVDDREENLVVPRGLGMNVIRFESVDQLRREMSQLGLDVNTSTG